MLESLTNFLDKTVSDFSKQIIENIYIGISKISDPNSFAFPRHLTISRSMQQAFWSALPWVLIILVGLPAAFSKEGSISAFFVVSFMALFMGGVGFMLPTNWNLWLVSGLISQSLNVLVFILFFKLDRKLARKNK